MSERCALMIDSAGTLPYKAFYTTHYPAPAAGTTYVEGTAITSANGVAGWNCYARTTNGI